MKLHKALLLVALVSSAAIAQSPQNFVANTLAFPLQNPPQQIDITKVSLSLLDNPGPATYCYWIVSNYSIGNSAPAGPVCTFNGPNTLVNGISVAWSPAFGATSYDILRTSNQSPPNSSCVCAISTNVSGLSAIDTGVTPYNVVTFVPGSVNLVWDNEQSGIAGQSQLVLRANGVVIFTINSSTGPSFTLPSTVVQTNQTNSYTFGNQNFAQVTLTIPNGAGVQPNVMAEIALDTTAERFGGAIGPVHSPVYKVFVLPDSTDTLTNKTLDTAGTGNALKINGQQITAVSGNTGKVATVSGTQTSGHLVDSDANGNLVDAGPTIPVGTVAPGSNGQVITTSGGVTVWGSPTVGVQTLNANLTTVSFSAAGSGNLQSNSLSAGVLNTSTRIFRVESYGTSTPSSGSAGQTITLTIGGVLIGNGVEFSTASTALDTWHYEAYCFVTATGSSGTIFCNQKGHWSLGALTSTVNWVGGTQATATINLTGALTFQLAISVTTGTMSAQGSSQVVYQDN